MAAWYSSLSARRAWIEITHTVGVWGKPMSLSARRAWIEICAPKALRPGRPSLSARRAWIEIAKLPAVPVARRVALRKESVDRN